MGEASMTEKQRIRIKAGSAPARMTMPAARAGYMRDTQAGIIAARPASLREHRDEIRRVWWRASALAMDMLQNSGRLRGTADQILADTVGVELQLNPRPDLAAFGYDAQESIAWIRQVKARFKTWAWNPLECDFRAKFTIPQQTDIGMRHWLAFGESLGVVDYLMPHERLPGTRTGTKFLLMQPQKLVQDTNEIEGMFQGVIHDAYGRPTHYRFEERRAGITVKVDHAARDSEGRQMVMHAFDPFSSEDVRGLSPLVPTFRKYLMAENTDEATAQVRFLQTIYAAILKSTRPSAEAFEAFEAMRENKVEGVGELEKDFVNYFKAALNNAAESEIRLGAGAGISQLAPDEDLEFKSISVPGDDYAEFMARLDRDTARALGVSYGGYTLDYSKATYASTNMENSGLWPIAQRRTDRIAAPHVLVPYSSWLDEEIAEGNVPFKGGYEAFSANRDAILWALCQGPSKPTADDEKRARASSERLANGTGALEKECGELGDDAEEVFESRVYWHGRYTSAGLPSPFERNRPSDPAGEEKKKKPEAVET
ncbi:MAG TPA: phage portal protein [Shinella sp.]|jgi:capsid protein|uniref:phage portal protein n=1 Tax=Shinella sp. TaxID=1870904 RepID=UPI002E0F88F6|nr:phage portal protein [Shinella sp.]